VATAEVRQFRKGQLHRWRSLSTGSPAGRVVRRCEAQGDVRATRLDVQSGHGKRGGRS